MSETLKLRRRKQPSDSRPQNIMIDTTTENSSADERSRRADKQCMSLSHHHNFSFVFSPRQNDPIVSRHQSIPLPVSSLQFVFQAKHEHSRGPSTDTSESKP